jgi:hypothetical protein
LPQYLRVGTGEVIDQSDARTGQLDIVIANEDQPFHREVHEAGVFLVEGVTAAGEVKSRLTTSELDLAIKGGVKFKALRNRHFTGDMVHANESDLERYYRCPPFFLVAFDSVVAPQTMIDRLNAASAVAASDGSGPGLPPIDAVFVLGQGWAINFGDGQGSLRWADSAGAVAQKWVTGWVWGSDDKVLVRMLMWLNAVMPRVLRFGSIVMPYLMADMQPNVPIYPRMVQAVDRGREVED